MNKHIVQYIYIYIFYSYFIYLFIIYFWLCWVFGSCEGFLQLRQAGATSSRCGDRSSSRCAGLSLSRPLPLRGTGSRRAGSVVVAHGPSRFAACGIFPDQGSNPRPLHQQAASQPLRHQGSPVQYILDLEKPKHGTILMERLRSPSYGDKGRMHKDATTSAFQDS